MKSGIQHKRKKKRRAKEKRQYLTSKAPEAKEEQK